MLRTTDRVSAATSSQVWGRVRGVDARLSATSTSQQQGSPASSAGWVACSDPSAATSVGFPRPAPWRRGWAGVVLPVQPRYHRLTMNESSATSRSIGKTVLAGLVVLIVGWLLLKVVIGIAIAIASAVAVILAIVAVIWAVRVLI